MNAIDEIYTRDFREVYQPLRGQGVHGETVDRRQGTLVDNIYIERFWRTIKYEDVYIKGYENVAECKKGVGAFITTTTMSACTPPLTTKHPQVYILVMQP